MTADNKLAWVTVEDNGPGIPQDQIGKLFEPFTRGDTARGSEGTGLGLAIVKRIVSQHQGAVVVNNRSEGGLKAQISFLLSPRSESLLALKGFLEGKPFVFYAVSALAKPWNKHRARLASG